MEEVFEEIIEETTEKKKKKKDTTQFKLTILAEDERLQEIFDRVEGAGQREAFVKEAIYYWDYALHRSPHFKSRFIALKKDFTLKKDEILYVDVADKVTPVPNKERKNISIRINIKLDDTILNEILDRVYIRPDFVKEAIDHWDYILHTTSLHSRYLRLRPEAEKKYYNYGTKQSNHSNSIPNTTTTSISEPITQNTNYSKIIVQPQEPVVYRNDDITVSKVTAESEIVSEPDFNANSIPTNTTQSLNENNEEPKMPVRRKKSKLLPD